MKWFKHISDSLDDPDISDAVKIFGPAAYLVFFRTLEIMAREFDEKKPGICRFSVDFLSKKYPISWQKTVKILQFYKQRKRIYIKFYDGNHLKMVRLNCPKLKILTDEWTSKKKSEIF